MWGLLLWLLEIGLATWLVSLLLFPRPKNQGNLLLAFLLTLSLLVLLYQVSFPIGFTSGTILLLPLLGICLAIWRLHRIGWLCGTPRKSVREHRPFLLLVGALLVLFSLPFLRMSDPKGGWALGQNFYSDHAKHNAVTAVIAEGRWPIVNPWLASQPLHFYWISYVPGAAVAQLTSWTVFNINRVLPLFFFALFLAVQYRLVRPSGIKPALLATGGLLLFSGWDWIYWFLVQMPYVDFRAGAPDLFWEWAAYRFQMPTVISLERMALYLFPHLFSLTCFLGAYQFLQSTARRRWICAGVLLGVSCLASSILAILFAPIWLLYFLIEWWRKRRANREILWAMLLAGGIVLPTAISLATARAASGEAALALNFALFQPGPKVLREAAGPFWLPFYILIEFGGALFVALYLFFRQRRSSTSLSWFLTAGAAASIFYLVLFCIPGRIDLSSKFGLFLKWTVTTYLCVILFSNVSGRLPARWLRAGTLLLLALGLPTFWLNLTAFMDTDHFHYTARFSREAQEVALWVHRNVEPGRIFQGDPEDIFLSGVVARPVAADNAHNIYLLNVPWELAKKTYDEIRAAWASHDPELLERTFCRYEVDYFFRRVFDLPLKFSEKATPVFRNHAGTLYRLNCLATSARPSRSSR